MEPRSQTPELENTEVHTIPECLSGNYFGNSKNLYNPHITFIQCHDVRNS